MKNSFIKRGKELLKKHGIESDLIDLESHYDSSLKGGENFDNFKRKMIEQGTIKAEPVVSEKDWEDFDDQFNSTSIVEGKQFYEDVYRALDKMKHDYCNMLFLKGRAGIGKSQNIKFFLESNQIDYEVAKKITPAYLYRFLYENNGKWIWFKDIFRLFNDGQMKEMIKAIGETNPEDRIITNYSYSKETKELPKRFVTTSKFIFDYNSDNLQQIKFKEDFLAILSRGDYIELVFDFNDICRIMREIAKSKEEKEVTEHLIDNYHFTGLNQFNLRTQQKAFSTYKWANKTNKDWKKEVKRELKMNLSPVKSMLFQFMGKKPITRVNLKRMMLQSGVVNTTKTAERRINNWIECDELYIITGKQRNPLLSLFDK